ncbi:19702_t:CDS:2 [Dentiscutata erythropus]|uniref:19702_t:CDS:1 n=1 Tax=Dentiscutata erythropus TaxID=1348616 RepID=A0A9N9EPG3_9GLOM|nr:19702_t:CDS:2 [Dentiscutata erythropus]
MSVQEDYDASNSSSTSSLITTPFDNSFNERSSASESSENEECETPPKEPYEEKYIKLTSVNALEFLPGDNCPDAFLSDSVLSFVHRATHLIFIWCFFSSVFAALLSMAAKNRLILLYIFNISSAIFYFKCAAIWAYCLYCFIKSSLPLKDLISYAKNIAIVICTIQALAHFSTLMNWNKSDSIIDNQLLHGIFSGSASENILSYGSVLSVPAFVLLEQFYIAYQRENYRKRALLKDERDNAQRSVYMAIDRFSERKGLYLRTISDQLQQTTNLAMGILKQLSPSHLLTKPHEQLSACSISFPTASISAIYTTIKAINYISSHLGTLSYLLFSEPSNPEITNVKREFDIGELIQHVADSLAGVASCANVELVVYHIEYEYGLSHLNVIGDEAAFRHVLLSLIKCILSGASPGACIELSLQVRASEQSDSSERVIKPNDKVTCTIEIIHNLGSNVSGQSIPVTVCPDANLTFKVLNFLGATLNANEEHGQQRFKINIDLKAGSPLTTPNTHNTEEMRRRYPHSRITGEPSVEELKKTTQSMRGQKVALHATSNSFFAKRITSCLTTWGTDISHVPIGDEDDPETPFSQNDSPMNSGSGTPVVEDPQSAPAQNNELNIPQPANSLPPKFIIIDDDIDTLKQQLEQLRNVPFSGSITPSTNQKQVRPKRQTPAPTLPQQTTAVIHFTSLTNYKHVKDIIQCYLVSTTTTSFILPQVLVIPKPAGPRRFITALHTTMNRIVVDPVYMPIATSPMSPGSQYYVDMEVNPMDQIANPPDNYFPDQRPSTPSAGGSNRTTPSSNPLSPRPSGRVVVIPRPKTRGLDRTDRKVISVNSSPSSGHPQLVRGEPYQPIRHLTPNDAVPGSNNFPESVSNDANNGSPDVVSGLASAVPSVPVSPPTTPPQPVTPPVQSVTPSPRKKKEKGNRIFGEKTNSFYVIPPINVLIVEDNPINQAILSTFMRKKNIKYECASNGQEAVDKWKKGGFHLILMDIQLPVMDGIEATKTIRRLEKSQKIGVFPSTPPVFSNPSSPSSISSTPSQESLDTPALSSPVIIMALTASSLPSDRQNALAAGCNDFLTKPVSLEWLEKKINEWGCMQALIDFDGWRRWKKGGEEIQNGF